MAQPTRIPPPPQLPTDWRPNRRDIGYRFDQATQTFQDGRYLSIYDPHGRWDYSQYTDPIRLGAPSGGPNWQPILAKWGLQALNAAGFINAPTNRGLDVGPGRLASSHGDDPIHPAFRRDMWDGVTNQQWGCIKPAVQLATSILDDPETLRFFAGCCNRELTPQHDPHVGPYYRFEIPATIDDEEAEKIYDATVGMRKYTRFSIKPFDEWMEYGMFGNWETVYGVTQPIYDTNLEIVPGALPDDPSRGGRISHSTEIWFPDTHIKPGQRILSHWGDRGRLHRFYLEECQGLSSVDRDRRIAIHPQPALLRTIFGFASTILHEFSHAFLSAYFPKHALVPSEPFQGADAVCEAGWAFEHHIWGGILDGQKYVIPPVSMREEMDQGAAAPFGLFADADWTKFVGDAARVRRLGGEVDYTQSFDTFPVHQSHTEKLFTKRFWDGQVARFGAKEWRLDWNDWGVRWKADPYYAGLETAWWGHFGRTTNPMGWGIGVGPNVTSL